MHGCNRLDKVATKVNNGCRWQSQSTPCPNETETEFRLILVCGTLLNVTVKLQKTVIICSYGFILFCLCFFFSSAPAAFEESVRVCVDCKEKLDNWATHQPAAVS